MENRNDFKVIRVRPKRNDVFTPFEDAQEVLDKSGEDVASLLF